jgi:hypothetical protein
MFSGSFEALGGTREDYSSVRLWGPAGNP